MKRAKTIAIILAMILGSALTVEKTEVGIPKAAAQGQKKQEAQPKLVPENLARGKKASASSYQDDARGPDKGVDGDFETRWCASSGAPTQWYQIDLERPEELTGCRITWEFSGPGYGYRIEGSADGKQWSQLVDQSKGKMDEATHNHTFTGAGIRYVKLSTTKLPAGKWASFYEFEVLGTKLVPAQVAKKKAPLKGPTGIGDLKVLPGFEATLFAEPPDVNYPTCLAAAPTGELFVGVDANGSLDAKPGRGKILRLIDSKGVGKADKINVFAKVDSPRGLIYDHKTLYVLHPPFLSAFHDDDGVGVANRSEVLVKGIGFDLKFRGADHTTNGIRMGIDGWIYIAVGDYGFIKATGKDGRELQLRGGGVVRVRPDGAEVEIVSRGQRNIYDVAIDPLMNLFTRDNTNDGDGWDVRLSHVVPLGNYGYPTLFTHFGEEIIQPLLDTGGGAPTGALFLSEPGYPGDTGESLLTCEWGRGAIHRHPLKSDGSTFKAEQAPFITISRPTDIDVDGQGRLYVSSWRNGNFTYSGENVGYVARVVPKDHRPEPFPNLGKATDAELLQHLASPSHVRRLATQREILRRGPKADLVAGLETLMTSKNTLPVRVAGVFTYKQLLGAKAQDFLVKLSEDAPMREFALKALADRKPETTSLPLTLFAQSLKDANPRVRLQAVIGLARVGKKESAAVLLPMVADADPVVAHVAVQALIAINARETCLAALNSEDAKIVTGALRVLQSMHETAVVGGLIASYDQKNTTRPAIFRSLCRLHFKEADWDGKWWGTRPDVTGPYYKPVAWAQTQRIAEQLKKALAAASPDEIPPMAADLSRHGIDFPEATAALLKVGAVPEKRRAVVEVLAARKKIPAEAIPLLTEVAVSPDPAIRTKALKALYRGGAGQDKAIEGALRGFALVRDASKESAELAGLHNAFLRDTSHAKRLDLFVKAAQSAQAGERELALIVLMNLAASKIANDKVKAAAQKAADQSMKTPETALSLLKAIRQTRAEEYAFQVLTLTKSSHIDVQKEATALVKLLSLDRPRQDRKDTIKHLKYDDVLAAAQKEKGDPALGARLFVKQGCIACHTIAKSEPPKGPYLGDVANRYKRPELIESILKPSAKIAQGFETVVFELTNGKTLSGFVVRESGDEVEIRDAAGLSFTIKKADIDQRVPSKISVMPEQLVDMLTVPELASILAYLEELSKTP
jgi:putative membrane-bound dehydrogenase-like protein